MSTLTQPKAGLFSAKASGMRPESLQVFTTEMLRILFLGRVTQVEMSIMGKDDLIHQEVRSVLHNAAEAIRQFDMKVRSKLSPEEAKLVTNELNKDKLFDIGHLVDLIAKVSDQQGDTYETFLPMMVAFLTKLVQLQGKAKRKVNMKKYKALFNFLTAELLADAEGGQTAVEFNEASNSLSFLLIQPDAEIPAHPLIYVQS